MSEVTPDVIELARRYLSQTFEMEGQGVALENLTREATLEALRAMPAESTDSGSGCQKSSSTGTRGGHSPGISDVEILEAKDFEVLAELVARCTRCSLHEERNRSVFGEGAIDARVVCVGAAPGAK